jgi:hypothetical protein
MDEIEERRAGLHGRTFDQGVQRPAVPEGAVGEDAVWTTLEYDEGLSCRGDGVEDVDAILDWGVAPRDADRVLRRRHMEGWHVHGG